jgi:hypothetical protein
MHAPRARPGARHMEPPCAEMPARAPAERVVWWWRRRGDHGVPGPRGGPVAGGVIRGRGGRRQRPWPGESVLFVDPAEIPAHADVAKLGQALAASPTRGQLLS